MNTPKYIPTLDECLEIVANNSKFKHKCEVIHNVIVHQFSYLLAKDIDFKQPIGDSHLTAEELRGITFVEQPDKTFKTFLMLPKFFNLNQTEGSMYHDIKDMTPLCVQDKLDGSMITFVDIGGNIMPKTKFSFFNEQAEMALEVFDKDEHIQLLVNTCINLGYHPIFELVSPQNRIVLPYNKTELRLLNIRKPDGSFKDLYNGFTRVYPNIIITEQEFHTLDELIVLAELAENKEGWVVQYPNKIIKVKTKWYFENHRIMTGDINVEHKIIEMTLNETIDDVLAKIPEDSIELRNFVNTISDGIVDYIDDRVNRLLDYYFDAHSWYVSRDNPVKKDYVDYVNIHYTNYFKEMMFMFDKGIDEELLEKFVIKDVLNKTNALEKARRFLINIGIETKYKQVIED